MKNYFLAACFIILGMLACRPMPGRTKGNIFRYINIGNDYRLLLGDKIENHLKVQKPVGSGYKLTGEGYEDANSIFIQVSKEGKIKTFQFYTALKLVNKQKVTTTNLCSGIH